MSELALYFRERNTNEKVVLHFRFSELEWVGLVEKADTAEGFRFTELGKVILRACTHPQDFGEAVKHLGNHLLREENLPGEFVGGPVRDDADVQDEAGKLH